MEHVKQSSNKKQNKTEAAKRAKLARRVLLAILFALPACGMTMGEAAVGTTGFMREHNRKLEIIRLSGYAPLRATGAVSAHGQIEEEK